MKKKTTEMLNLRRRRKGREEVKRLDHKVGPAV
jgi:hypothetical protein